MNLFDRISPYIPDKSKVLDLGCGDGSFLYKLIQYKNCQGYGIEIDFSNILTCIKRGIPVYQGNIDDGLSGFPDNSYDVVILSLTLQQITKPLFVLQEMVRVGKQVIVTFPNFGYWRIRAQVSMMGRSPLTSELPYQWYETPNIRIMTIRDFRMLCHRHGIAIVREIPSSFFANFLEKTGLFILEKQP